MKLLNSNYINCTKCKLCTGRRLVVFGNGEIPADIMFIGEAPGESEDVIGTPFSGVSGNLLHRAIKYANEISEYTPRIFITNIVACKPPENRVPYPDESMACRDRLQEEVNQVNPIVVILLGNTAKRLFKINFSGQIITMVHPAFILRDGAEESSYYQKFKQTLADIFSQLKGVVK